MSALATAKARLQSLFENRASGMIVAARGAKTAGILNDYAPDNAHAFTTRRSGFLGASVGAALAIAPMVGAIGAGASAWTMAQRTVEADSIPQELLPDVPFMERAREYAVADAEARMTMDSDAAGALTAGLSDRVQIFLALPEGQTERADSSSTVVAWEGGKSICQVSLGGPWTHGHVEHLDHVNAPAAVDLFVIARQTALCAERAREGQPAIDDSQLDSVPMAGAYRRYLGESAADRFAMTFLSYWDQTGHAGDKAFVQARNFLTTLRVAGQLHGSSTLPGDVERSYEIADISDLVNKRLNKTASGATAAELAEYDEQAVREMHERVDKTQAQLGMSPGEWSREALASAVPGPALFAAQLLAPAFRFAGIETHEDLLARAEHVRERANAAAQRLDVELSAMERERGAEMTRFVGDPMTSNAQADKAINRGDRDLLVPNW